MPLRKIYDVISQNRMKILIRSSWIWWLGQKLTLYAEFQLYSSLATACRFQYLLNLLCACVQRSALIFRADKRFSWFGFQSWPNLPNFEVIFVENTQLCSKNLFLHINEETLALSHLRTQCLADIIDISRKSGYTVLLVINLVRRLC